MRVKKASVGYMVLLMPDEQQDTNVIEKIAKLKESGKVAIFISGYESTKDVIYKLIKNSTLNK